uniref:Uncharacterized protein n=1 Tax=Pyxicephalus adspersus TaxID=30357 RepID=A0AAV3AJV5_PYXAD|nr:TPA: hypothetical protein GDO54_011532 [Pyxicephalus adspersus]
MIEGYTLCNQRYVDSFQMFPGMGTVTEHKDIAGYCALPALWSQFGEDPFPQRLCPGVQSQLHKDMGSPVWCNGTQVSCTEP